MAKINEESVAQNELESIVNKITELASVDTDTMNKLPKYARLAIMEAKAFVDEPAFEKHLAANSRCQSCKHLTSQRIPCPYCATNHPGDVRFMDYFRPIALTQDESPVTS